MKVEGCGRHQEAVFSSARGVRALGVTAAAKNPPHHGESASAFIVHLDIQPIARELPNLALD
jgi:hypothetical protein